MSFPSTVDIFKAPVPFEAPAEGEGAAVDIPPAIVALLAAAIFPHTGG